jgi:small-conductance mechanosensitive channel/CRP-like cAMP-binding protein
MSFAQWDDWMIWGAVLLVAFPILIIALGEISDDVAKSADYRVYSKPLLITRNGVLPFTFAAILLRKIVGYPADHMATKIVDTVLWILVLNAVLAFMNILLFDQKAAISGRVRIPQLLLDIMRLIFVVCGAAVTISTVWNVNLSSLVTALGVGSVVIGLALQDTLGSLFSGIALVSARDFRVGDWVRFGTEEGPVMSQNWRTVTIKTRSGDALVLPNGVIARNPLTVLTAGIGSTLVTVDLRFPYQYSPDVICAMLAEAAVKTAGFVLDPAPVARVASFEDSAIRYAIGVRVTDPAKIFAVRSEYLTTVWFMAQRQGIVMVGQYSDKYLIPANLLPNTPTGAGGLEARLLNVEAFSYRDATLGPLLANARFELYRNGQTLVERGVVSDVVFILLSGSVRAVQAQNKAEDVQLHVFEPGQFMLSKATLRAAATPYSLRATKEVEVIALPVADFKRFCASDNRIAREIEQILSAREEVAHRAVAKTRTDPATGATGERSELMRELFQ